MNKFVKIAGFTLLGLVILGAVVGEDKGDGDVAQTSAGSKPAPSATTESVSIPLPEDQRNFISAVNAGFADWNAAQTDMQRGAALAQRSSAICGALKTMQVSGWIGKVVTATTNSEGKGVFGVELADNVTLTTWNNAVSDIGSDTLIEPSSDVFKAVSSLKKGDSVKFSGAFFSDQETCVNEQSLTLKGKVTDPEFTFKFSGVSLP